MNKSGFRSDITGLRALAVLSVIIFHFNHSYLPGGFVGVDVFFVISGFLMTSIIFTRIDNGSFSLLGFYYDRIKRIIPALTIVCIFVLCIGFLIAEPLSYQLIGKHAFSSLLFFSNYVYMGESGYFDADAYSKYLLHTWSLSVEWQFYLAYPLAIYFVRFISPKVYARYIILFLTITSFAWCTYQSNISVDKSYFMTYARAWEMLIGGLAFLFKFTWINKSPRFFELTGVALIVVSLLVIDSDNLWPGYYTLLPTLGAFLVLIARNEKTIMSGTLFENIGLWSYSAYLIHWPLIVILKKEELSISFPVYLFTVIVLSFLLYSLVERKRNFSYGFLSLFVIACAASFYVSQDGVKQRVSEKFQLTKQQFRNQNEGHMGIGQSPDVQYFNSNEQDFDYILVGNSFARHYFYYISKHKIKVASLALDGCTSTHNFYSSFNKVMCEPRYQMEIDFINKHPGKPVIISRHWPGLGRGTYDRINHTNLPYQDYDKLIVSELDELIKDISHTNHNIYIVGATPGSSKVMFECLAQAELPLNKILKGNGGVVCNNQEKFTPLRVNQLLAEHAKEQSKLHYIDTSIPLCHKGMCDVIINGNPVYTDNAHMSKIGSEIVGGYVFSRIKHIESN